MITTTLASYAAAVPSYAAALPQTPAYAVGESSIKPNVTLILVASALIGCGIYLALDRQLVRILLGVVLASNGVAVLFLVSSGRAQGAALVGERPAEEMSDPLPQAMVLTAIVIALATVSFVLALAYRQWQLTGSDDATDDVEDAIIQRLADRDQTSSTYDSETGSTTEAEEDAVELSDDELADLEPVSASGDARADAEAHADHATASAGHHHNSDKTDGGTTR